MADAAYDGAEAAEENENERPVAGEQHETEPAATDEHQGEHAPADDELQNDIDDAPAQSRPQKKRGQKRKGPAGDSGVEVQTSVEASTGSMHAEGSQPSAAKKKRTR